MVPRWIPVSALLFLTISVPLQAESPDSIDDKTFDQLHQLIKPKKGESPWMEVDWYPSVWEARKKAAEEGKPIFLMAGSGGAPATHC